MNGYTSIILVTHNQLPYTKLCMESIARQTPEPYELIVVDNGSTDGTGEWCKSRGLRVEGREPEQNGPVRVTVIANAENRGFPAAANQGIRAASGSQILLLNNDTLVTAGWLGRMLRALNPQKPEAQARNWAKCRSLALRASVPIGMVEPVSNFVSGAHRSFWQPRARFLTHSTILARRAMLLTERALAEPKLDLRKNGYAPPRQQKSRAYPIG